jgi:hypothetical protein
MQALKRQNRMSKYWTDHILDFYKHLQPPPNLPEGVEVLMPFNETTVITTFKAFYNKYYSDSINRYAIIGINPGRFGSGVTGVPFTDPIRLQTECGIHNDFAKKQELSSVFMYEMINSFGGPEAFYKTFYITSYSPLGFVMNGKNLNYYDNKLLATTIEPFAVECINEQLKWGINREVAFCLGDGKNFLFLSKLNAKHRFFDKIIPLSHPRFIMQYKLKLKQDYIQKYLQAFNIVIP